MKEAHSIQYGNKFIEFDLQMVERKTMEITVNIDSSVHVKAPSDVTLKKIKERIHKRARWILKQQHFFSDHKNIEKPKEYVSGETHRYLGKNHRLKIYTNKGEYKETVKLSGGYFCIYTSDTKNPEKIKTLMNIWIREKARIKLYERFTICTEKVQKYSIKPRKWSIRYMPNRWGSFTKNKNILLNPKLIEAPVYCIDYVIFHELAHLKYPYHDTKFFNFLTLIYPEWERAKERLEWIN